MLIEIRGPDMDLESYGLFLLDLSRKANPVSTGEEQERFAKERFMDTSGSTDLRFWLGALKPATLQNAIDLATQYESAYQAAKPRMPDMGPPGAVGMVQADEPKPFLFSQVTGPPSGAPVTEARVKEIFYFLMQDVLAGRGGEGVLQG